jgi:predicted TIM-barrel fold metal-dependent hydrolase
MAELRIVDADMHVRDGEDLIRRYLPEPFNRRFNLYPVENFDRTLGGRLGKREVDARVQLADMQPEGIELAILYPTTGLFIGEVRERDLAVALCRAYNDWVADYCRADPDRLKAVAMLQVLDVEAAAAELERAVSQLGLVGAMVPAYTRFGPRNLGERVIDPLYATAERLDVPVAIHANGGVTPLNDRFGSFLQVHVFSHVPEQIAAVTAVVLGGVFERFSRLRVGFMEAGCGWVPFWMEHMDEEFELRYEEAPELKAKPSDYITNGRAYFGVEPEEKLISLAAEHVGERVLMYASDYPHWDSGWPNTSRTLRERDDISDRLKARVLGENALSFYGLRVPAAV